MKRMIFISLLLFLCFISALLISCKPPLSEEEYFTRLDEQTLELSDKYQEAYLSFLNAEKYEYSVDIYSESLSNYDNVLKLMPEDQNPPQKNQWYKPICRYTYKKADGKEYAKIEYQEVKFDDSLELLLEEDGKTPIYESQIVEEYWFNGASLIVKLDSSLVYDGPIIDYTKDTLFVSSFKSIDVSKKPNLALNIIEEYLNTTNFMDSIFSLSNKQIFNKRIMLYKTINVTDNNFSRVGFRISENTSGYEEDFSVLWENIKYIEIDNLCLTLTNNDIKQIEFNSEKIGTYSKEVSQIWNNETVIQWFGDRIYAKKMIIDINYGTNRNPIDIP